MRKAEQEYDFADCLMDLENNRGDSFGGATDCLCWRFVSFCSPPFNKGRRGVRGKKETLWAQLQFSLLFRFAEGCVEYADGKTTWRLRVAWKQLQGAEAKQVMEETASVAESMAENAQTGVGIPEEKPMEKTEDPGKDGQKNGQKNGRSRQKNRENRGKVRKNRMKTRKTEKSLGKARKSHLKNPQRKQKMKKGAFLSGSNIHFRYSVIR